MKKRRKRRKGRQDGGETKRLDMQTTAGRRKEGTMERRLG